MHLNRPSDPQLNEFTYDKTLLDKCAPNPGKDLKGYFYTTKELSDLLNLSVATLSTLRRNKMGPKYFVFGYRTYRYARADVLAYIEERTRKASSDQGLGHSSGQVSGPKVYPKFSLISRKEPNS